MKLVKIINMCLNETYTRVRVGNFCLTSFLSRKVLNKEMLCRHYSFTLFHSMPL